MTTDARDVGHIPGDLDPLVVATNDAPRQTQAIPADYSVEIVAVPDDRQTEGPAPTAVMQPETPATIAQQDVDVDVLNEVAPDSVDHAASEMMALPPISATSLLTGNKVQPGQGTTSSTVISTEKTAGDSPAPAGAVSGQEAAPDTAIGTGPHVPLSRDAAKEQPGAYSCAQFDIEYNYDEVDGHRILRLQPTRDQWDDFPAVLAYARSLGAEGDGCFKVIIPDALEDTLPEKPVQSLPANAYKVKLIRRTACWQVSTVPSEGLFAASQPGAEFPDSVDAALKNLKRLFRKHKNRQLRNIRYRVDVPAWTKTQRRLAGVPERSPIYPLKGDKLDKTKAVIPGIHTPYVYESASSFGATFQIHAEDFRLASLNHLYRGRKIWIVIPATDVHVAEKALGRGAGCSQFMRHRAEFFFPDKLQKLGIPFRIVDQRPGETIVILPDAYHEGFSCGYTIAEAKNYADPAWTTDSYQPCQASCKLATAIPAAFMRPLGEGEQRLDLCFAYGDAPSIPVADTSKKREHEETAGQGSASKDTEGHDAKRLKPCE
ncbi:hypothetical protein ED733_000712 [Metarhizium rileyi]|uniref:JmjC domain-containing protein n=1 Tax=Metarhizium rileyi (strain RCEF 4871) TaxID=1649241 RepID=A0A5C6G0T5_METRR|nr:hypothetical protein ED733_000712 [Metarhizium rileyi]